MNEVKIIQDCLSGQTEEYRHLVSEHQTMLLRTAYHFLGNWDDAKDASQEAFIKAYRSLHRFQQNRKFSTWLYRILVNVCKDRLKSAERRYRSSGTPHDESSNNPGSLEELAEKELLRSALKQMPKKRRLALILVDIDGFSYPEASHILECSESTLRVTLMNARKQLRKLYLALNAS